MKELTDFDKITLESLIDDVDKTDNDRLKQQLRYVAENEPIIVDIWVYYDNQEDLNIVLIQIWTDEKVYITYQHPLWGLTFTCGLRNPPKSAEVHPDVPIVYHDTKLPEV